MKSPSLPVLRVEEARRKVGRVRGVLETPPPHDVLRIVREIEEIRRSLGEAAHDLLRARLGQLIEVLRLGIAPPPATPGNGDRAGRAREEVAAGDQALHQLLHEISGIFDGVARIPVEEAEESFTPPSLSPHPSSFILDP